jgi:hypothetical protein
MSTTEINFLHLRKNSKYINVRKVRKCSIWLDTTQKIVSSLKELKKGYEAMKSNYTKPARRVFADEELDENSVIRKFRITASDGKIYRLLHCERMRSQL